MDQTVFFQIQIYIKVPKMELSLDRILVPLLIFMDQCQMKEKHHQERKEL